MTNPKTYTFSIHNYWTGEAIFEADLDAMYKERPHSVQLGMAVRAAWQASVSLSGADLCGAYLRRANLGGADLSWTNLRGADLSETSLYGASLRGTNLSEAKNLGLADFGHGLQCSIPPFEMADHGPGAWPVRIGDTHILIGCEYHATDEWAGFDDDQIKRMDPYHALDFWRLWKEAILTTANSHQSRVAVGKDEEAA